MAIGFLIILFTATYSRSVISMTNSTAAKSSSTYSNWWSSRAAGFSWPFPATPPIFMRSFRCGAGFGTQCRFGSRSSSTTHWQIFRAAKQPELATGGYDGGGIEVFYGEAVNNRILLG